MINPRLRRRPCRLEPHTMTYETIANCIFPRSPFAKTKTAFPSRLLRTCWKVRSLTRIKESFYPCRWQHVPLMGLATKLETKPTQLTWRLTVGDGEALISLMLSFVGIIWPRFWYIISIIMGFLSEHGTPRSWVRFPGKSIIDQM